MDKIIKDNFFDYNFSSKLINDTRELNKLLTMEIELSHHCNFHCRYCYSNATCNNYEIIEFEHLKNVILQAYDLGVRFIVIIGGGEPLLYKHINELIKYIYTLGIEMAVFTNGSLIDKKCARILFEHNVL